MKYYSLNGLMMTCLLAALLLGISQVQAADDKAQKDSLQLFDERLSMGGEFRLRGESKDGFKFDSTNKKNDDSYLLLRSRLHFDAKPVDWFRAYLELQDAREWESDLIHETDVPNEYVDEFDIRQAFFELHVEHFSLRTGRQPLHFGSGRLLGDEDWSNVGLTFDAVRLGYQHDTWAIDTFVGQPVMIDWANFNDPSDHTPSEVDDNTLYGVYSTVSDVFFPHDTLDGYFLARDNNHEDSRVYTLGTRYLNAWENGWDVEGEFAFQFGDYHDLDHQAFALHMEGGHTFHHAWHPRVALLYNFASGDDNPKDNDHEAFDDLFAANHYHYGIMDLFAWSNMHQVGFNTTIKPVKHLKCITQVSAFWLAEEDETKWYKANGSKLRSSKGFGNVSPYAGTEIDIKAKYQATKHLAVEVGYSHFFTGDFASDTGSSDDADKVYVLGTFHF